MGGYKSGSVPRALSEGPGITLGGFCVHRLTGEGHQSFVGGLESPLQDPHILAVGEGAALLPHSNDAVLVECLLVHIGVSLQERERQAWPQNSTFSPLP